MHYVHVGVNKNVDKILKYKYKIGATEFDSWVVS